MAHGGLDTSRLSLKESDLFFDYSGDVESSDSTPSSRCTGFLVMGKPVRIEMLSHVRSSDESAPHMLWIAFNERLL